MIVNVDFNSDEAIYEQLKDQIMAGILNGSLENNFQLPSVRRLAGDLEINMHTVNKAYKILENEGFVTINKKKGAFVNMDIDRLSTHYDEEKLLKEMALKIMLYKKIGGNVEKLMNMIQKSGGNHNV